MFQGFRASLMASAAVSVAFTGAVFAQDEDEEIVVTDVIRVEGQVITREESELAFDFAQYGNQVQLISAAEIQTGGFTNFGEAAAGLIRGANIGYSPDEGEFTIRIDGGTDRDTLLLVDGVPYFDRSSPLEDLWPATAIDPRMIDSVEVYRGGQSLYFGSNGGLGVVSVRSKQPNGEEGGQIGFYTGSFKTRELYGNMTFNLDAEGDHSVMVFGRSYETDAHELFDPEFYTDNILALGGFHEFPYSYNNLGVKYLWQINETTEFRAGAQFATIDFRDSFPWLTVFQPNRTEFPIYEASFKSEVSDRFRVEVEGHYQDPRLHNTELDARICNLPRLSQLTAEAQALAADQGITGFATATEFETFAASAGIPAGCVTNPDSGTPGVSERGVAANSGAARNSYYFNQDPNSPFFGQAYGTPNNPFPIGAPIGYVIQSGASFGDNVPTKGFGSTDQFKSGYIDYGVNARGYYTLNDYIELVGGIQYTAYTDNSAPEFGVRDVTYKSTGLYGDLRLSLPILEGANISLAARQDFNDPIDDQTVWKFGARQNFGRGLYARASGGTSYSAPKIDEIGAFGSGSNVNPDLQPQEVEAFNAGVGLDGEIMGGTFNVELGYFDTQIDNLFGSAQLEDVCEAYGGLQPSNLADVQGACQNFFNAGVEPTETLSVNRLNTQEIEGFTIDVAFDFDQIQADFSYTAFDSLEDNPRFENFAVLEGAGVVLDGAYTADELATLGGLAAPGGLFENGYFIPGESPQRQSSERPEWVLSGLVTYTPTDRWIFALNPRFQGPEFAYQRTQGQTGGARLVDENGVRTNPDLNFGDYFVLNGSIQYFLGEERQHRFLLRAVNILDEDYAERAGGADQRTSRAAVRGELGINDSGYYYMYDWNGKPQSFFLQYEYSF